MVGYTGADQAPFGPVPNLAFINPSQKAIGEFVHVLAPCNQLVVLSFTTTWYQYIGFAVHHRNRPKARFSNNLGF